MHAGRVYRSIFRAVWYSIQGCEPRTDSRSSLQLQFISQPFHDELLQGCQYTGMGDCKECGGHIPWTYKLGLQDLEAARFRSLRRHLQLMTSWFWDTGQLSLQRTMGSRRSRVVQIWCRTEEHSYLVLPASHVKPAWLDRRLGLVVQ